MASESSRTLIEDFVIFLFLESVYLEECKCSSLEFSKEKTEKIRDGTKSLSDVCSVAIYKDVFKFF